ncbi:hypothetical protein GCM10009425_30840 [Pseudomonas asuensis]|uniref:Uncharacterized protein n=1 Tax=Pseudomonas asuensis TaxID=1825787 RepID=A0ABQ2GYR6_9PSED|nr:hypothetical protein GCM10009425_30840 [Pseudomonas asuensis]
MSRCSHGLHNTINSLITVMNPYLPLDINQWSVDFDPYGFTVRADWLTQAEKTEDETILL